MRSVSYRIVIYMIAGFSAGLSAWIAFCGKPFVGMPAMVAVSAAILLPAFIAVHLLLRRTFFSARREGLTIAPAQILASDLICMAAAAVAAFFIIDGFSERLGGPAACIADPLAADVIAFMMLPAAAVLALFVAQTGSQRLNVGKQGLTVDGISGTRRADWDDIVAFRPERQHVLVGRVGLLVPRHLRTNLIVVTSGDELITIFDPGSGFARTKVLAKLKDAMPGHLKPELKEMEDVWR